MEMSKVNYKDKLEVADKLFFNFLNQINKKWTSTSNFLDK